MKYFSILIILTIILHPRFVYTQSSLTIDSNDENLLIDLIVNLINNPNTVENIAKYYPKFYDSLLLYSDYHEISVRENIKNKLLDFSTTKIENLNYVIKNVDSSHIYFDKNRRKNNNINKLSVFQIQVYNPNEDNKKGLNFLFIKIENNFYLHAIYSWGLLEPNDGG